MIITVVIVVITTMVIILMVVIMTELKAFVTDPKTCFVGRIFNFYLLIYFLDAIFSVEDHFKIILIAFNNFP